MLSNLKNEIRDRIMEKDLLGIIDTDKSLDELCIVSLVEITLLEDTNIYALEYRLYLPDKKELQEKLKECIGESER